MIIEMMGLPGAGKTSLSNHLVKRGIVYINAVDMSRTRIWFKIPVRVLEKISIIFPSYRNDVKNMKTRFDGYCSSGSKYTKVTVGWKIKQIAFLRMIYAFLGKSEKVWLFDEGIIQHITTLCVCFGVDDENIPMLFDGLLPDSVYCVNLRVDNSTAFDSIRIRNRHVCNMDEFDDDKLKEFLALYSHANMILSGRYASNEIDRSTKIFTISELIGKD